MDSFMEFLQPHIEAYLAVVKRFNVFEGRARRKEFWMFFLYNLIISVVFGILSAIPIIGWLFGIITGFLGLAIFVFSLAVGVRRLHDTNRSGLMWLLALIPLVGIIILIVFWAQEGNSGKNQYGSDPKSGRGQGKRVKSR
jgi:uncharacterized membrane protein YhaH (DUF805 family)